MKKFFKYSFLLMAVGLTFVSCKEDDDYTAGKWNAEAGYADLYFPELSRTVELDPTDPTQFDVELVRRNTAGALTVNLDVIENDDDVFEVGPAVFADGDSLATITVKFPNAEIGTPYGLQLTTTDPKLVSEYSDSVLYSATVTRVKWNYLGDATFVEGFWYELTDKCPIYQRDDVPEQFRLEDPFKAAREAGLCNGAESKYLTFRILKPTEELYGLNVADMMGDDDLVYFNPTNTGYFHPSYSAYVMMYHPAHFSSLSDWTYNRVVTYQKDSVEVAGKNRLLPGKIHLAPYYYMVGIGGWNNTQSEGIVQILFPGYIDPHVADIASDDFTWEDVFTGSFTSGKTGAGEATLYKGTCVNKEDGCDTIFAQTYGTAYKIVEPYAEGYDIYFAVDKDGKIVIPDGYRLQPTGLDDNMGHDIYAKIDQTTSSFSESEVILTITFVNEDETLDYGTSEEVLANITWSKIATGTYYYVMFADNEEGNPEPDPGYELYKRDDKDDTYKIADWLMGTDFMFTWNHSDNSCVVLEQDINYQHPSYGSMYIIEGAHYSSKYAENTSYYDPAAKMFHFFPAYFVSAGSFGQVEEFFEITEEGAVKRQATLSWGNAKLNTAIRKANRWAGKKMNKAARLSTKVVASHEVLAR